ncbi:MAG: phosphoribosyl-AMP cyclohydrolase [Flavobacteriales bacterium]|nr:phosphoribosyl-AMP cyclohydrolase [Flavobacteriales bacterium]|tara:strand:- start:447 stop:905 length:459 start_codon:yes stop_codon:yes gene_type:complete
MIELHEIKEFQKKWSDGIISIGNAYKIGGDYKFLAIKFVDELYAFSSQKVLFKPTLASESQFRLDSLSALSYFIGGNDDYSEDVGFAIKGWSNIRWDNAGIIIEKDLVICMGNYFFSMDESPDLKVEYSIVLKKINGFLKLVLHDSHLPYQK